MTDRAQILPSEAEARLGRQLSALEQRTRHQFLIVTVTSLGGRDIDSYAHDLFNSWGIGREGINDGVLLLVAPTERRVRIQVGYGLETILTNQRCAEIIERAMLPSFRKGRMEAGIEAGATAIVAELERPAAPATRAG